MSADDPLPDVLAAWRRVAAGETVDLVGLRAMVLARFDQLEQWERVDRAAGSSVRAAALLVDAVDALIAGDAERAGDLIVAAGRGLRPPEAGSL